MLIFFLPSNENGNKYVLLGLSANLNTTCYCFLISSLTKAKQPLLFQPFILPGYLIRRPCPILICLVGTWSLGKSQIHLVEL